ncbi:MAG: glycosyltransferase family 9 protein, partial [Bacteroidota bacterium]
MKILILTLDLLGDMIMTTPVISALREAYPYDQIDILVRQQYRELFLYNPNINNVLTAPSRKEMQRYPSKYFEVIKKIRSGHYDIAISTHSADITAIFTMFSGAKKKYGFIPKKYYSIFYTKSELLGKTNREAKGIHRVEINLTVLELLGIQVNKQYPPKIWIDDNTLFEAERLWVEAGLGKTKVIGLNPGGYTDADIKQWTNEGFAELADMLQNNGFQVVFFGGTNEIEVVDKIRKLM